MALCHHIIQSVPDGILLVQDKKIVFSNDGFKIILGKSTAEEIAGRPIFDFIEETDHSELNILMDKVVNDGESDLHFVGRVLDQTGKSIWLSANCGHVTFNRRPGMLMIVRDISQEMIRENGLKNSIQDLRREIHRLRSSVRERYRLGSIVGKSPAMLRIYETILQTGGTDVNVLILGESGTGKELVAKTIHDMSDRSEKPMVTVNCGAIPENLMDAEFFGHRKGSFTGAHESRQGYLDAADGGTLFLDEVGEISPLLQVKLLRALENGEYFPVGDAHVRRSDFRLITATNQNIDEMLEKGTLREDFYYRISVIPILLPPLRDRKEDIPILIDHFLEKLTPTSPQQLPPQVIAALLQYHWPGNVRQLQNIIQRYLTLGSLGFSVPLSNDEPVNDLNTALINLEKQMIANALEKSAGNKTKAAQALGIDRRSLHRKMQKLGLI